MADDPRPKITAEQLTAAVAAAVRGVPGVVDLHRNPLQALGERVKLEWHGPVRLTGEEDAPSVEVHIVVAEGRPIPQVAEAALAAVRELLTRELPACAGVRLFVDDIVTAGDAASGTDKAGPAGSAA